MTSLNNQYQNNRISNNNNTNNVDLESESESERSDDDDVIISDSESESENGDDYGSISSSDDDDGEESFEEEEHATATATPLFISDKEGNEEEEEEDSSTDPEDWTTRALALALADDDDVDDTSSKQQKNITAKTGEVGCLKMCCFTRELPANDSIELNSILQKSSKCVARNPCIFLWVAIMISIAFSAIGLIVGEFQIEVVQGGWWSRGTLIANRQMQVSLVNAKTEELIIAELLGPEEGKGNYGSGSGPIWDALANNVQSGFDILGDEPTIGLEVEAEPTSTTNKDEDVDDMELRERSLSSIVASLEQRKLRKRNLEPGTSSGASLLAGCDLSFYSEFNKRNLAPVWKIKDDKDSSTSSILDSNVVREICIAESNTQQYLEDNDLCDKNRGCLMEDMCLPPYSIVFYARLMIDNGFDMNDTNGGFDMDCNELANAWTPELQQSVQKTWMKRISILKEEFKNKKGDNDNDEDSDSDTDESNNESHLEEAQQQQYPYGYYPALVESNFDITGISKYTSSIFDTYIQNSTSTNMYDLYESNKNFDRGTSSKNSLIEGVYDTSYEDFVEIKTDDMLDDDMTLALGSAVVISILIMVHTQSPLITGVGLLQIILSFPLSFFAYKLIFQLQFFPFLNFIGIFVVFALGAGDIYVAFDKWTNYRRENLNKSTEYIAALALPESLSAMFLTTLTTAIAFFATAICPVAPIKMFAIFCGLLIIFDYILTVAFIFPALCIYDKALIKRIQRQRNNNNNDDNDDDDRGRRSCSIFSCLLGSWLGCVSAGTCCRRGCKSKTDVYDGVVIVAAGTQQHNNDYSDDPKLTNDEALFVNETERIASDFEGVGNGSIGIIGNGNDNSTAASTAVADKYNLSQRVMLGLSHYLHMLRWPLLVICIIAFSLCCYFATTLKLPQSSEVRLLGPNVEFEKASEWRKNLLSTDLSVSNGGRNNIIWGVLPADTGDQTDPNSGTQLVLDDIFQPSSTESQLYLLSFCDKLFQQEFASPIDGNYVCPMNRFDEWLSEQSISESPDPDYTSLCGGVSGVPVPEDDFHACISNWALQELEPAVLSRNGVVQIMTVQFRNKGLFTDPYEVLEEQRSMIEDWMTSEMESAPSGVDQGFFAGFTFYWHDTNGSMLNTAYSGAAIALGASAVIILLSSKSLSMMAFSTLTILYILTSVTSMLSAIGWSLGFIEAICFSILIGVSVDFVIHFAHAYTHHKGEKSREERTKYAMVTMGPSILATALTTFFSAVVMLFCTITFFQKFALILFFTVIQATLGSFIFFLTLTNCFGPTNPTYLADKCLEMCRKKAPDTNNNSNDNEDTYC